MSTVLMLDLMTWEMPNTGLQMKRISSSAQVLSLVSTIRSLCFLTGTSALFHSLSHHQFILQYSFQHGPLLWLPHHMRSASIQQVPWWTMGTVCWQYYGKLIHMLLCWFHTNGQLSSITLLCHSLSSKDNGEEKMCWKKWVVRRTI